MQVLVVENSGSALPAGTTDLLHSIGWRVNTVPNYAAAAQRARTGDIEAAILTEPPSFSPDSARGDFESLLRLLDSQRIAAVMLSDRAAAPGEHSALINVVDPHISLAELRGRLAMIERYHGLLKRLEGELRNMSRLSERLHHHFREVDEELRLAARLQRDFLPDLSKPFGNLKVAAVYRPASWVSGDMFDAFRIDDDYTGVYVVDAVGHGMAASLLTMFIKRAIVPTHRHGDQHTVLNPSQVMAALNDALAGQSLPNCQFVTAAYGLFHHPTRRFQFARGGHPYPLLVARDATVSELQACGGLLGLAKGEEFSVHATTLNPGDKVLFYTDGVELCFQDAPTGDNDARAFHRAVASFATLPIEELMSRLEVQLSVGPSFADPRDDLTILGLEVLPH